jgi:hypothetical protein
MMSIAGMSSERSSGWHMLQWWTSRYRLDTMAFLSLEAGLGVGGCTKTLQHRGTPRLQIEECASTVAQLQPSSFKDEAQDSSHRT